MDLALHFNEAVLRIFLALLLGSVVGLEREFTQKSAGLRTHILVCLGSTVFTLISISDMFMGFVPNGADPGALLGDARYVRDPARIAAQIVTGIGFIGGGAVLRYGAAIRGLTTAASLWMMASIGMLVGTGYYALSIVATLVTFLVLFTIGNLERSVFRKQLRTYSRLRLSVTLKEDQLSPFQQWIERNFGGEVIELKSTQPEAGKFQLVYTLHLGGKTLSLPDMSQRIAKLPGVSHSSLKVYQEEE